MKINFFFKKKEQKQIQEPIEFDYPLPFEDWCKTFKFGSKYHLDSATEIEVKKLVIRSSQLYSRLYQNQCEL